MKVCLDIELKRDWIKSIPYEGLEIDTYPGVFSHGKIDKATDFLLRSIEFSVTDKVLDIGCGSGVIGLIAAKQVSEVECTDVDTRAVALTDHNIKKLKSQNIKVYGSNQYDSIVTKDFTKIIHNLPAQVAKPVQQELLKRGVGHLVQGGEFWVICQARLQRFVKREMKEVFSEVKFVGKESHFVIIKGVK